MTKNRGILPLLLGLSFIAISCGGGRSAATITEEKQTVLTYPFGDPDPVPILAKNRNAAIYPYFRFDGFTGQGHDQEWNVVRLENDFITVYVLPQAGGKVWGAVEKSTGKDFIYKNDVMKFRDVAMRGPWTSGGIEFNFGLIGHAPSTATPVDYLLRQDPDGGVSCIVGGIDLPSRTQWRVRIRLPRDAASFETASFWYNPTPLQQSYYHWMNAAVHARDDLQFYYPGQYYVGHGGDVHPWPVNESGIDLSLYKNHYFGSHKSLHVLGSPSDFSGGYWHDLDFGFGHWARYDEMPGRKIWIWSLSRSGAIWENLLTDKNGQYVEVQAGRQFSQATLQSGFETPFTQAAFLPYAADFWTELWFPVKQTGGIAAADPDGVLNIYENGGTTHIAFNALRPVRSELLATVNGAVALQAQLDLAPMQVFERNVPNPPAGSDVRATLGGRLIWRSGVQPEDGFQRPVTAPEGKAGAGRTFLVARQRELMRDFSGALESYSECVGSDALHISAMVRIAEIHYRRAEYDKSLQWAKRALAVDTYNPAANFACGTVLRTMGKYAAAREALSWAARSPEYRGAAYTQIAEINLAESRPAEAGEYALKALDASRKNIPALWALAVAQRRLGRQAAASGTQAEILDIDPLNHLAAAEAFFLNASSVNRDRLTSAIRSELPHESYLEMASCYAAIGFVPEAVQLLRLSPPHPIVHYWLAYLTRETSPDESKGYLEKATQASPRLVFPFRSETIPILQWAAGKSSDWKNLYYLALIYWSRDRLAEAAGLLAECRTLPEFGPFYLARAELLRKTGRNPGVEEYTRARELAPDEWRCWLALARRHAELSSLKEALDVSRGAFEKFPGNFMLGLEYARALIESAQYPPALEVLERLDVLPYEGASEGRMLYEKAHLLLAAENIRSRKYEDALAHIRNSKEWPEHLGVGKPYDPDERLQEYMENLCLLRLGRPASKAPDPAAVEKLKADLQRGSPWKYNLLIAIFPQ